MDLTHRVRVPAPLDEAWAAVNDPERLAALVPGSTVDSFAADTFTGTLKIKLGSTLFTLAGDGRYAARDDGAHRLVLETSGTDRHGDAAARATHTLTLARADGGAATDVTVETSMTWTGRPARLGDGVVVDAVDRVLDQVGTRSAARVAEGLAWIPSPARQTDDGRAAAAVVDHPVALGGDLGGVDQPEPGRARPAPSPSPGPAPRPPDPKEYVYRPYRNEAEPHVHAVRNLAALARRHVVPYAGLGLLAVFVTVSAVRRARS